MTVETEYKWQKILALTILAPRYLVHQNIVSRTNDDIIRRPETVIVYKQTKPLPQTESVERDPIQRTVSKVRSYIIDIIGIVSNHNN